MRRVFVSHGLTQDATQTGWLATFLHELQRGGWQAFEYRRDLQQGPAWRAALWQALLEVDAGLVLQDRRARRRRWVRYENAVLQARSRVERGFVWHVVDVEDFGAPGATARECLQRLARASPARRQPSASGGEWDDVAFKSLLDAFVLRARIALALRDHVDEMALHGLTERTVRTPLVEAPIEALPGGEPWVRAAQAVLGDPEALLPFVRRFWPPALMQQVLEALLPLTVPAAAAAPLAAVFHREGPGYAFAAPRDRGLVVQSLLRRAWGIERPMAASPVVQLFVDGCAEGPDPIVQALHQALAERWGTSPEAVPRLLAADLPDPEDQNDGAPCAIVSQGFDSPLREALHRRLPTVLWVFAADGIDELERLPLGPTLVDRLDLQQRLLTRRAGD